jgi:hypothetical protein
VIKRTPGLPFFVTYVRILNSGNVDTPGKEGSILGLTFFMTNGIVPTYALPLNKSISKPFGICGFRASGSTSQCMNVRFLHS